MSNAMTVSEFARLGGLARKKALSPARRKEIAKKAGLAPRKPKTKKPTK